MNATEKAMAWLNSGQLDEDTRNEISRMLSGDEAGVTEAFYRDLEFGTGGLRGIMGVGSNRMNKYTVGMATQGLANYLKKTFPNEPIKVAIAHDSRNNSRFFAETTAAVFAANNIRVYLFEELRPTPELSFAIRTLGCKSGVVITASHNPKEYNGYKAYWSDGAQIVAPHDKNIIAEVLAIRSIDDIRFTGNEALIASIGSDLDEKYLKMIQGLSLSPTAIQKEKDMKIVFSSIHGTGITLVPEILRRFGFTHVHVVDEQATPDGNFPTVIYPNPEEAEALTLALKKAVQIDADLVMATDPDADRVGIAVKNNEGQFVLLNGNQTGGLLIHYLLTRWNETGKLTGNEYIVKTIVTTELIKAIADHYQVKCYDTLTGFKFIAALIRELEGKETFIGGGEESYGYMIGDQVRDKDAIASCAMIAEMAAWFKSRGKTVFETLIDVSLEYGLYLEGLQSLTKKGKSGAEEIQAMMKKFRENPPAILDGEKVIRLIDYQTGTSHDLITGTSHQISFPTSNVLQFVTDGDTKISVRPSGTEPKIKFYFSVNGHIRDKLDYFAVSEQLGHKISRLKGEFEKF